MKKWQIVLLIILAGLLIAGGVGYMIWNKPHDKVEDANAQKISVAELTATFENNEQEANDKFLNKAIEVTGTVSETETNQDGQLLVILSSDNSMMDVQCTMRESNASVATGEQVTIKGFCSGVNLFGVLLTDCVISK